MKYSDVFTPGSFPFYTYVENTDSTGRSFEKILKDSLDVKGMLVSIAGPSKSGKTVLVEKAVGGENLIPISGSIVKSTNDLWNAVFDWIEKPQVTQKTTEKGNNGTITAKGEAGINFLLSGKASIESSVTSNIKVGEVHQYNSRAIENIYREISGSEFTILIDDFHYIPKNVQVEVAQQLKECVRRGVKIIYAAVPYHFDDIIRANPDFSGRVVSIDFMYWSQKMLEQIAILGFSTLKLNVSDKIIRALTKEAAGSPQLMQSICLELCRCLPEDISGLSSYTVIDSQVDLTLIMKNVSTFASYDSFLNSLQDGPKSRGRKRKQYALKKSGHGDVYYLFLNAMACPPTMSRFKSSEIRERITSLCIDEIPTGSSITGAIQQMVEIAAESNLGHVFEWSEEDEVFRIKDPYFLCYLRWSGKYS